MVSIGQRHVDSEDGLSDGVLAKLFTRYKHTVLLSSSRLSYVLGTSKLEETT